MGVVVRRCIDILTIIFIFPNPLVLALFLAAASLLLCSFLKCFFGLVYVIFLLYNYKQTLLKEHSRSLKKNRDHANISIKLYP